MRFRFYENTANASQHHCTGHDRKKSTIFLMIGLLMLGLTACGSKSIEVETITTSDEAITLDINDSKVMEYTVEPEDADSSDMEIVKDDGITVTLEDGKIHVASGNSEGDFTFYIKNHDIESDHIKVSVIDKERVKKEEEAKKAAEEAKKAEEEKARKEAEEKKAAQEAAKKAEEEAKALQAQQNAAASQNSGSEQQYPTEPIEGTVWVASSGNGTKYHSNPNCSRMKNPIQLTKSEAAARGFGPCKKCY